MALAKQNGAAIRIDSDRPVVSLMTPAAVRLSLWMVIALAAVVGAGEAKAQTPIPPSAPDFAMAAAQSDQYEIVAGQDALGQSHDPRVRAFAEQMIQDHRRTGDSLRQAAMASGLPPPPPAMSSDQAVMLGALQSLRGVEFDRAYAHQQVLAHHQALAVEGSYASAGMDPNLQAVARQATPIIESHLQMAKQLSATLGSP